MADVVWTVSKPSDVQNTIFGNKRVAWFNVTADTGDYVVGGLVKTAASLGFKHMDEVCVMSLATQGTAAAGALGVGVKLTNAGTTVTFYLYEAAATGLPFLQKTAEAMVANFEFRFRVVGN